MTNFKNDYQLIERLARTAHAIFCEELRARGYRYGEQISKSDKTHNSLKPYDELSEDEKLQNRDNVRDIPDKLDYLGYRLQLKSEDDQIFRFNEDEIEVLAEKEHARWVRQKQENGWRYGSATDKSRMLHRDLVPWNELTESDKEKDRFMVRAIPRIVEKAGYLIVHRKM